MYSHIVASLLAAIGRCKQGGNANFLTTISFACLSIGSILRVFSAHRAPSLCDVVRGSCQIIKGIVKHRPRVP